MCKVIFERTISNSFFFFLHFCSGTVGKFKSPILENPEATDGLLAVYELTQRKIYFKIHWLYSR